MLSESPDHMLRPFITLEGQAQSALDLYGEVFSDFVLHALTHHAAPHEDLIMTGVFEVKGQAMMISDSFISHEWSITPGISFFIDLEDETSSTALPLRWPKEAWCTCPPGITASQPSLRGCRTALA